jgi:hypothetical protein
MKKIFLLFCLLLLTCHPAAANPVIILGVGQVELGNDIMVTESPDKKGNLNYGFKVKDGAVWRGAVLFPISNIENGDILKPDAVLDRMMEERTNKDKDVLSTEKSKRITIGGKEFTTATAKFSASGGLVANIDFIIIPGTDGMKQFGFMCADSDAQYWRPIMQKIASNIP